ncbi:MAG: restriction endonuclease subunit S [Desulfobacteria bacterium]
MKAVEGWSSSPLGQLLISKNDKSKQVKSTEYAPIGSYPIVDQSSEFICGYHDDKTKLIETNLPLTVFGDHTRHTKFISFPFICGADGTQLLKPKSDFEDKFFFYLVAWAAVKIGNYGYDRHFKHLKEFECDYPDDPIEQTKIAEVLSTVDRAIEQTEALIAKQQRIKTGLMQDLLTRGIDEHGNLRSEQTHEFKDSPLGRIPVEWEVVTAGEVAKSLVPGRDKPELDGGGVPWITMPDIEEMYLQAAKTGFSLSLNAIKAANARLMPKGTVLMSCVGEFGIATIATVDVVANQQLHGFICDQNVLPEWLVVQITGDGQRIDRMATQTTIKYLNKTGCESILIAVPDLQEQERSIRLLRRVMNLLTQQRMHLAKFQAIKTALMQDLLTGKKRVTPLLKETEVTNV